MPRHQPGEDLALTTVQGGGSWAWLSPEENRLALQREADLEDARLAQAYSEAYDPDRCEFYTMGGAIGEGGASPPSFLLLLPRPISGIPSLRANPAGNFPRKPSYVFHEEDHDPEIRRDRLRLGDLGGRGRSWPSVARPDRRLSTSARGSSTSGINLAQGEEEVMIACIDGGTLCVPALIAGGAALAGWLGWFATKSAGA